MEILIISGLSGAGKSKAASFLEDMGFYIVDNMPAVMMLKFAEFCAAGVGSRYDRVALVYDVRTASSSTELYDVLEKLRRMDGSCRMLFLTADQETIIKRYKETRRRHPLCSDSVSLEAAVRREREVMAPVRAQADFVIDTSRLSTAQLRGELLRLFDTQGERGGMTVSVTSFGFKYGLPMDADLVFDVRFMPNPFYIEDLRDKTGMDHEVYDYVFSFPQTNDYLKKLEDLLSFSLPLYAEEGKTQLVIAVGCTGGHHRSVSVARALAAYIRQLGYHVSENHRDMGRGG
ncbi:RNase adapter RapZ [Dysosmobacter sp. HCP28S3_G4]|uniref:RNase adapter RapZ n=1 Tax=Dysosmobacter sp. HCP28S3_G4 TaxID=3438938 RepID=UPI003F001E4C|nr:RNase adapter RapZ [Dysosmobacter sp.]